MDRQALIADLMQARACAEDAARHIQCMINALGAGASIARAERSHAAEKMNRACEIIRRSYDG